MAKAKKRNLSPEELLKQALVPTDEQPYEVPGNWVWTRLGNIIELISGRDVPLAQCNNDAIGIPYILGASNIENDSFTVERWIEKPVVISIAGDILLSVKGTIGKIYLQQEPRINISRQIMALRALSAIDNQFLKLYLTIPLKKPLYNLIFKRVFAPIVEYINKNKRKRELSELKLSKSIYRGVKRCLPRIRSIFNRNCLILYQKCIQNCWWNLKTHGLQSFTARFFAKLMNSLSKIFIRQIMVDPILL